MLESGYVIEPRNIAQSRWYKDCKVMHLYRHLRLMANYEPHLLEDHTIQRGQLATSQKNLSEQTGLTIQEVRTALNKLKKTGEVTVWSNRHMTVITLVNYDIEQSCITDNQQTNNGQITDQQQSSNFQSTTMKERKKKDKEIKKDKNISPLPPYDDFGFSVEMRERLEEWIAYKKEMGKSYKQLGLNNLLKTVQREIGRLGENTVLNRITDAMAAGWQGMNLDKLESTDTKALRGGYAVNPKDYDYSGKEDSL